MQLRVRLNREINQISDQRSFSAVYVERATEFEENAVFQVSSKRPLSPNDARFTRSHSKSGDCVLFQLPRYTICLFVAQFHGPQG